MLLCSPSSQSACFTVYARHLLRRGIWGGGLYHCTRDWHDPLHIIRGHEIAAIKTMHDLTQALRFADTFIFIKNGTVHIHGDHEIVTPSAIEDVYGLPVMIGVLSGVRCVIPDASKIA